MKYHAVHYSYVTDQELLKQFRPAHREYLRQLVPAGLVAAGSYPNATAPGALLIVQANSVEQVADLLSEDPFWQHGIINERRIEEWNPLIGIFAS